MSFAVALPLLACAQGFFVAALLATHRSGPRTANRLLAGYFAIFGLAMGRIALASSGQLLSLPHLAYVLVPIELLYGPLFYLYVRTVTGHRLTRRAARHLVLPGLALLGMIPFYAQDGATKRHFLELASPDALALRIATWSLNWIVLSAYLVASLRALRLHGTRLRRNLSTVGRAGLTWLRAMTWILVAAQVVDLVGGVNSMREGVTSAWWSAGALLLVVLLYAFAFVALRQPELRYRRPPRLRRDVDSGLWTRDELLPPDRVLVPLDVHEQEREEAAEKYRRSGLSEEDAQDIADRIRTVLENERPHTRSDLSLADLADLVGTPTHHVSQVLNERLGGTFFEVINRHRVAEVQRMLTDPRHEHLTVLAIAQEAGFHSKSAFNAAFKAVTGTTPSQWRRQQTVRHD